MNNCIEYTTADNRERIKEKPNNFSITNRPLSEFSKEVAATPFIKLKMKFSQKVKEYNEYLKKGKLNKYNSSTLSTNRDIKREQFSKQSIDLASKINYYDPNLKIKKTMP